MTDDHLSDDELLSSFLDGELTAEDAARLDRRLADEPELAARRDALADAQALAATPVAPLGRLDADRLRSAALASAATAENITDLAAARQRRRSAWPARLATAAAGVVALAIGVTAIQAIGDDDNDDFADGDSVSTEQRGFDGEMADEGDDDSSADTAEAAMLDPDGLAAGGDMSDDDMAGDMASDGMGDDDMADAPEDESADSDDEFGSPPFDAEAYFAENTSAAALFDAVPGFDPLDDELGDFADTPELDDQLRFRWSAFADAPAPTTTTVEPVETPATTSGEELDARLDLLARVGLGGCDAIMLIVDEFEGETVRAADYATATVDGRPITIGLFRLADDRAEVLVIDQAACTVRTISLFS